MREILFRGKDVHGEWVEGYFYKAKFCRDDKELSCFITVPYPDVENKPSEHIYIPDENTIGQYTGLTDKNGKKIFEGDILHFKAYQGGGFACPIGTDIYYRVLFGHCNPDMDTLTEYVGFWALGENYDEDDLHECGNSISYLVNSHGACVIGNIHDNPELLKGGAE